MRAFPEGPPRQSRPAASAGSNRPGDVGAAGNRHPTRGRTILVVMGVSGAGKTTIGRALAARLGWPFQEGDDLHPAAAVVKMRAGHPLDDRDRLPWLARIAGWIDERRRAGEPGVITCSALKRGYRELLAAGRPQVRFLYLRGSKALIHARLASRRGHFMPASLLDSQFATLEEPDADERTIQVDIGAPIEQIVQTVVRELDAAHGGAGGPGSGATGAPGR